MGRDIKNHMVKVKYPAFYTDDLGCERAEIYLTKEGIELKVRNCIFNNDNFNFDFYTKNKDSVRRFFYLKDYELIEYSMDIKIPIILTYDNNKECVIDSILCIKRHKNYYNNSLMLNLEGKSYLVHGYNLQELLYNMKEELPQEYTMECNFSCMLGVYCIEANKENGSYYFKNLGEESDKISNKDFYLELSNFENKRSFKELQKFPITYV